MLKALIKRLETLEKQRNSRQEVQRTFWTEIVSVVTGLILKRYPVRNGPGDTIQIPGDDYWKNYGTSQVEVAQELESFDKSLQNGTARPRDVYCEHGSEEKECNPSDW
jgi:hypothetical protein